MYQQIPNLLISKSFQMCPSDFLTGMCKVTEVLFVLTQYVFGNG